MWANLRNASFLKRYFTFKFRTILLSHDFPTFDFSSEFEEGFRRFDIILAKSQVFI